MGGCCWSFASTRRLLDTISLGGGCAFHMSMFSVNESNLRPVRRSAGILESATFGVEEMEKGARMMALRQEGTRVRGWRSQWEIAAGNVRLRARTKPTCRPRERCPCPSMSMSKFYISISSHRNQQSTSRSAGRVGEGYSSVNIGQL